MKTVVRLMDGPLPEAPLTLDWVGAGAIVSFDGVVRGDEDDRAIDGLEYETYDPMAEMALRRLGEQACERYGLIGLSVEHSRGYVPAGMRSFRLRVAAGHRQAALRATDWFIDTMKRDVPIWKRPVFRAARGIR